MSEGSVTLYPRLTSVLITVEHRWARFALACDRAVGRRCDVTAAHAGYPSWPQTGGGGAAAASRPEVRNRLGPRIHTCNHAVGPCDTLASLLGGGSCE